MSLADATASPDWVSNLFGEHEQPPSMRRLAREPRSFAEPDDDAIERFKAVNHFEALWRAAAEAGGVRLPDDPLVLVLNAGDGTNAVAPCLRLFRGARIVAAEQTARELAALQRRFSQSGAAERVIGLEMAPESGALPAGGFDLVAGVSVLNRLFDPDIALANAYRLLRAGGRAVFMEPFDGYGLIRLGFDQVRHEAELRGEPLAPAVAKALAETAENIAARTMPDREAAGFREMDQKWLFSRESLSAAARQIGFSAIDFVSHHDHPSLYRDFAGVLLERLLGPGAAQMPAWAWAVFDDLDQALPPPVKRLLMLEGALILTK